MNVFQYAIIATANALNPGEEGYEPAQRFSRQVIQRLSEAEKRKPESKPGTAPHA